MRNPASQQPASAVTLYRYHALIRKHLDFRPFEEGGLDVAARAMRDAAAIMDHPPDLINVGIEQLVTDRIGLPAFSTLDRLARRVRALVNGQLFATIAQRLTADEKARLDGLLQAAGKAGKRPLHEVKRLPKRSSLRHFQELIDHMERLDALVNTDAPLVGIPELKRKHFAAEARALDAAELKDFRLAKRHAVLLCLIHRARVQVRDDLAAMFIKRMSKIHVHGKEHLDRLRSQYREKAEVLVATMSDVIRVLAEQRSDTAAGREIRRLVGQRGSIDTLQEDCNAIAAHSGDNYLPLLWPYYKSHRPTLLRMVRILNLKSTTEDRSLIDALELILAQERQRGDWLDGPMDLSFTTHLWRKTLTQRTEDGEERIHRRHFEVCVFSALANELKSGDVAVPGSEEYADQGEQLLSWEECEPQVAAYCAEFGLPADPITFVNTLQSRLMQVAEQTDQEYVGRRDL